MKNIYGCLSAAVLFCILIGACQLSCTRADAKIAADPVTEKTNTSMEKLTPELSREISSTTPAEPASSDLTLVRGATRLSTRRIPQGYTFDGTFYYYLSNLSSSGKHSADLRLTRVRYLADGGYEEDYMTLRGFGHGTNIDCAIAGNKTWLWTGSDADKGTGAARSISCFTYRKGAVMRNHAKIRYRIPFAGKKGFATNCYPAVSPDGRCLAVRYTRGKYQGFQLYRLKNGTFIDVKHPIRSFRLAKTKGDFQGFDICGTCLYTIEGTACRAERKELHKAWYPIKIRTYDYKSGRKKTVKIRGAAGLTHREPEGIQVTGDGAVYIGLASHYKDKYTCMNIYKYK